jgi:hypothetical protein
MIKLILAASALAVAAPALAQGDRPAAKAPCKLQPYQLTAKVGSVQPIFRCATDKSAVRANPHYSPAKSGKGDKLGA